ncbi:hypothetical protein CA13_73420 [Planctomycetes bacterium CA13]|uniref:Uncharacterized protein n=1 Tax=Novipirellula herctigrandis TaxID=2527986 RepID=A0A5C5YLS9_9BACT|nr:hypothetical protein CA13_73420 [Planctomycetes bacterium CA13]
MICGSCPARVVVPFRNRTIGLWVSTPSVLCLRATPEKVDCHREEHETPALLSNCDSHKEISLGARFGTAVCSMVVSLFQLVFPRIIIVNPVVSASAIVRPVASGRTTGKLNSERSRVKILKSFQKSRFRYRCLFATFCSSQTNSDARVGCCFALATNSNRFQSLCSINAR